MAMEPSTHDEIRELSSLYVLGGLTPEERAAFEAHLATCAECAAEVESLKPVVPALAQAVPQLAPPPAVRDRLLARVSQISEATQRNVVRVSQETKPETPPIASGIQWLPLAASLVLVVGLGVYALQLRGRIRVLETELQDALARADVNGRQLADTRRVSLELQNQMAVLTAPDVTSVNLAGQPVSPAAQGRAFWSRSRGLVFTASNLPPPPPDRTYQLWFIVASDGAKVSAGIFSPDAGGSATLLFTSPPGMPQPAQLAVTLEPSGGVPQPTGAMYLAGLIQS